jgi:transcriptional regulator with XRE-family HTH domain
MVEHPSVPVRVRRVSGELRELRLRHGLGAHDVARSMGISPSKLSRMERGNRGLDADDVSALLGLYRVPRAHRSKLLALVREGVEPNWWQLLDSRLPVTWQDLARFESEAAAIHSYETMMIPGLLQTAEYMTTLAHAMYDDVTKEETDRLVAARTERQRLLKKRDAPELCFFIEETVLRRRTGDPGVMCRQLQHLVGVAGYQKVDLRIVPLSAGLHAGADGSFLVLHFADQPSLLYVAQRSNAAFVEETAHVAAAVKSLRRLRSVALSREDSVDLIASLGNELLDVVEEPRDGKPGPGPCSLAQEQP